MTDIVINAGLAKYLCGDEHKDTLAAMGPDETIDDVIEALSDDAITPDDKALCIRQIRAFWNAQGSMAQSFKVQAEDWRKVVETLRREIDGNSLQE